jgi:hypothetical protein
VHTVGYEVVLESLPLPLAQPEYGLNGEAAILSYVRRDSPSALHQISPVMELFPKNKLIFLAQAGK